MSLCEAAYLGRQDSRAPAPGQGYYPGAEWEGSGCGELGRENELLRGSPECQLDLGGEMLENEARSALDRGTPGPLLPAQLARLLDVAEEVVSGPTASADVAQAELMSGRELRDAVSQLGRQMARPSARDVGIPPQAPDAAGPDARVFCGHGTPSCRGWIERV